MATRVGINGFGRIGRQSLKALIERAPDVEVVAVNDLVDAGMNAHLFKHDSTYGAYPGDVRAGDSSIVIDGHEIRILAERDPANLPWGDLGVDIVLESTGIFTDAVQGQGAHRRRREQGASSAPRPRARTSRSSWASTRIATTRPPITSSATPAARRIAWPRPPRWSMTS